MLWVSASRASILLPRAPRGRQRRGPYPDCQPSSPPNPTLLVDDPLFSRSYALTSSKIHLSSTVNERRASTVNKDVRRESEPGRDEQVVVWAAQSVDGRTRKSWTCIHGDNRYMIVGGCTTIILGLLRTVKHRNEMQTHMSKWSWSGAPTPDEGIAKLIGYKSRHNSTLFAQVQAVVVRLAIVVQNHIVEILYKSPLFVTGSASEGIISSAQRHCEKENREDDTLTID